MTDPIPTADAGKVLGDLGEVPRVTTTAAPPPTTAPAAAPGLRSLNGEVFDSAIHAIDRNGNPMQHSNGSWQKKRGNGARKLKGAPLSGASSSYLAPVKPKPGAAPPPSTSSAAPPPVAGDDQVHDVEVETAPQLMEADYDNTARGIQRGVFALARLRFGDAWKEDDAERTEWVACLRRLWCHYQLPRLGVLAELAMLLATTIAKRREDAATREGWKKCSHGSGSAPRRSSHRRPTTARRRRPRCIGSSSGKRARVSLG